MHKISSRTLKDHSDDEIIRALNSYTLTSKPSTAYRPDHLYAINKPMDPEEYQRWMKAFKFEAHRRGLIQRSASSFQHMMTVPFVEGDYLISNKIVDVADHTKGALFFTGWKESVSFDKVLYVSH